MKRLVITLPQFRDIYNGEAMRALTRLLEQTFQRIKVDETKGQTEITGDHTVTAEDSLLLVDTTSGNVTITLPTVARWMIDGKLSFEVKKMVDANRVRVVPGGSDTIDGYPDVLIYVKNTALNFRAIDGGWAIV